MSLYSTAVATIRTHAEVTQAALDAQAALARADHIAALRAACTANVPEDSPARAVAELLAQAIAVGRDDGSITATASYRRFEPMPGVELRCGPAASFLATPGKP